MRAAGGYARSGRANAGWSYRGGGPEKNTAGPEDPAVFFSGPPPRYDQPAFALPDLA